MDTLSINQGHYKHDRTFLATTTYWLTRAAYSIAPRRMTRLMREKGFKVRPFHLSDTQRELLQQARSFSLKFNNNTIKVFEWGEGPVILLVHGWAGRALQFESLIRTLLKNGYKVVAFDQKGHGESSSRFSSFPEIVRSTGLVATHYGNALHNVVAHSIGANSMFKVCENVEHKLQVAVIAPVGDFVNMLETLRLRLGIYEKLYTRVIQQIENENELRLADLNKLNYMNINRHDVLLVHDKFDRINEISVSHEIHRQLKGSSLMQTERLGHSRILNNPAVLERVITHFRTTRSQSTQ